MKKDRNTFFEGSSYMGYSNGPFVNPINQGFYGPNNYNTGMMQNQSNNVNYDYNDLEARISKLERQINRLDARLNKLENNGFYSGDDGDTTNVYMV